MSRTHWHTHAEAGRYVLARHWPPRFDFVVEAELPVMQADRLAQQVRQDMWRALQNLRGFSPVVEVLEIEGGLKLRAGGRLMGPLPRTAEDKLTALLADPKRQARWGRWARARAA